MKLAFLDHQEPKTKQTAMLWYAQQQDQYKLKQRVPLMSPKYTGPPAVAQLSQLTGSKQDSAFMVLMADMAERLCT